MKNITKEKKKKVEKNTQEEDSKIIFQVGNTS